MYQRVPVMSRVAFSLMLAVLLAVWVTPAASAQDGSTATPNPVGVESDDSADSAGSTPQTERSPVRLARATWDTGWFQAEIYKLLLERLGYPVEGPTTMGNAEFYAAVAAGEVDLWPNGWFPAHDAFLSPGSSVEVVGTSVDDGALQGYFIDATTAEAHGIDNLADLADPELASLFDRDSDGRADLVGCDVGWACALAIDHHLSVFGLEETVEHVQGNYSPLIAETFARYRAGEPVLYFTWTPNWTVGELVPGRDVVWLEVPFESLPGDQAGSTPGGSAIAGLDGCSSDPCLAGWPPNDIRAVANADFLAANPAARTLLEQIKIPAADISAQNAEMVNRGGDPDDIRRHAQQWIDTNLATVQGWIDTADPDAVAVGDAAASDQQVGDGLRVAVRALAPFVIYESGNYSGFEVELVKLLGASMGTAVDFYAVDTIAKQVDDISRGVADIGLGGVAITHSREDVVDFTLPTLDSGLTILTPTSSSSDGWFARIGAFARAIGESDLPWLLVVFGIAVLISAHVVWLLERRTNPDFSNSYGRGIWDSLYWSIVTMSTVGYGDKVARGNKGRLASLIWIALGTLVFASFTAAIASSLAVNELRSGITGPDDLAGHKVATVEDTSAESYLQASGIGPVVVSQVDEAYVLLAAGGADAVVFDASVLRFHASHQGAGEVMTVDSDFDRVLYGLMVAENEPELLERLNLELLQLIESGAYDRVHDAWFGTSG